MRPYVKVKKTIKLLITFISLVVMYFAFDYLYATSPKPVKFYKLDEFRRGVLENYNVSEIDIYFSRPSLFIEINSEGKLTKEIRNEIIEKLRPIINKTNMDIISEKYWGKDTSLFYVRIYFNEIKENTKIKYLEIELSQSKDYKDWN